MSPLNLFMKSLFTFGVNLRAGGFVEAGGVDADIIIEFISFYY